MWTSELEKITGYAESDLKDCAHLIWTKISNCKINGKGRDLKKLFPLLGKLPNTPFLKSYFKATKGNKMKHNNIMMTPRVKPSNSGKVSEKNLEPADDFKKQDLLSP